MIEKLLVGFLAVLTLFFSLSILVIKPLTIVGVSMNPTLKDNERYYVLKYLPIESQDIIAFKENDDLNAISVKRVIGMPGDRVEYDTKGVLYINSKRVNESYLHDNNGHKGTLNPKISNIKFDGFDLSILSDLNKWSNKGDYVPENMYFVLGDNREQSYDSRFYGYVKKEQIIGLLQQ